MITYTEVQRLFDIQKYFIQRDLMHKAMELNLLMETVTKWESENPDDQTVPAFLEWLGERDIQMEIDSSDSVKLATIHAVKGLEFPVVFIAGMNEGKLPHRRSKSVEEIEEERRLCYVAVTRAKDRLYLSSTETENAGFKSINVDQSRFVNEIFTGVNV